jgi:P-type Cu+ transporter
MRGVTVPSKGDGEGRLLMPNRQRLRKNKEATTRDPQCGKTVDPKTASALTWEGKTYYFCSQECRRRFDLDPPGDASF